MAGSVANNNETPLLRSLVRSLTPEFPALESGQRIALETQVADFVGVQISSMPAFLRLPYCLCMSLFDWSALLRYGRLFRALDIARQRDYLAFWANSPIAVMRDFVKLIRSCTLLQYLDHPLVSRALQAEAGEGANDP